MIRIKRRREIRGDKTVIMPEIVCGNPLDALRHLVVVEFLLGGMLVPTNDSKIRVETTFHNGADVSIYRGCDADMKMLRTLIYFYLHYEGKKTLVSDGDPVWADERMSLVHDDVEPLLLSGIHRMNVATLLACGIHCPKEISSFHHHAAADLIDAAELVRDGRCSSIGELLAA